MFKKVYLKEYIFTYDNVCNILSNLCNEYYKEISRVCIGKTNFNYDINCFKIGCGKKNVLLIGATHSNEIVTTYFILDFMISLLKDYDKLFIYSDILSSYTFHFIPILNVDGYIITTSNIITNFKTFSKEEIEKLSSKYLNVYNNDDKIASTGVKKQKEFYNILKADVENIKDLNIRKSVECILKNTKLDESVLNIWSANGLGVDQNSNSIHRFCEIKKLRARQKFANLRYNDIPVTMESPMSFPGCFTFDRSPENYYLYKYITYLYNICNERLIAIFSYHSTGGMLFSLPEKCCIDMCQMEKYIYLFNLYSKVTDYEIMEDNEKYGVMDYYRCALKNTFTFTVELSKLNANPIGPFANINALEKEVVDNKNAVISVIDAI